MDESFDFSDMSWLTQRPSSDGSQANFNLDIGGNDFDVYGNGGVVSLEEGRGCYVLYDNVVCQDISLDEEVDQM